MKCFGEWAYTYINEHSWHELGHVKDPSDSDTRECWCLIYGGMVSPSPGSGPDGDKQSIFSSKTACVESSSHNFPLPDDCSGDHSLAILPRLAHHPLLQLYVTNRVSELWIHLFQRPQTFCVCLCFLDFSFVSLRSILKSYRLMQMSLEEQRWKWGGWKSTEGYTAQITWPRRWGLNLLPQHSVKSPDSHFYHLLLFPIIPKRT